MKEFKKDALKRAAMIADWICAVQTPESDGLAEAGRFLWEIKAGDKPNAGANNWNMAFAIMGLLAAAEEFNEPRYEVAALNMGRYLKTLQIFSPFMPEHYGAIREMTPQTPWCYTRDALSAAWAFIELYRHTGDEEYIERAKMWAEWFLKDGLDSYGWPRWGVQFEPYFKTFEPQLCNDMHGSFQGGSLNFFYQLYQATGEQKWVGEFFVKMADIFVDKIQQADGFFRTVDAATGKVPPADPQNGLHRANDDLGCLGLLAAAKVTGDKRYLAAVDKFITAVFTKQHPDGSFETSCAAIPVVLNTLLEGQELLACHPDKVPINRAITALLSRQIIDESQPLFNGGFDELSDGNICARSGCYALISLLKQFGSKSVNMLSV